MYCSPDDKCEYTLKKFNTAPCGITRREHKSIKKNKRCHPCILENNQGICDRKDCSNYRKGNQELLEYVTEKMHQANSALVDFEKIAPNAYGTGVELGARDAYQDIINFIHAN